MDLDLLLEKTSPLEKSINKTDTLVPKECLDNSIKQIVFKQNKCSCLVKIRQEHDFYKNIILHFLFIQYRNKCLYLTNDGCTNFFLFFPSLIYSILLVL